MIVAALIMLRPTRKVLSAEFGMSGSKQGRKIEGRGTATSPSACLHIALRGTAAQDGSAAALQKSWWIISFSGAVYALLRSAALSCSQSGNMLGCD